MAELTKIEWADHTFNPVTGCQKVGPGCDNCYAEGWAKRSGLVKWGPKEARRVTSDAYWRQPIKWNNLSAPGNPKRVFCGSLCDVFDNDWPEGVRERLGDLIRATPNLIWMLLTKRIGNAARFLAVMFPEGIPSNVWVGATIVNQAEADRDIPKLLATPAAVRFLSMEPLLGLVDLTRWIGTAPCLPGASTYVDQDGYERQDIGGQILDGLDWIIVGGESGPKARPMHPDWARSLRDQCQAAGVAFHFKQWGEWGVENPMAGGDLGGDMRKDKVRFVQRDREPDGHLREGDAIIRRIGKARAGRLLDGREWNEVPV
ncbi:MAG: phage Gp37Gp68 [Roseovarius sp. BRH_c41]|uniref:phage Gp37/Gp68 family protein n=1 Tax=Roseovarius sp. BRH_c41 TaxID=1629709 RepID=UPI0005F0F90D|nr:phage Gp37/Gp68 family protein [Roseovarius sp. BRH_c41]KJS45212.1 MAG: phage Gp37Gp68 [Roseovarius sp. BRH_c41]